MMNMSSFVEVVKTVEEAKASTKNIVYILSGDGEILQYMKTEVGEFINKPNKIIGMDTVSPSFNMKLPKIPFEILCQTVSFFRNVCKEFANDESMVQIYYKKAENEYELYCPIQTTNKVHISFERNQEYELDQNYVLVMDIHSHNTMEAFFSGTDDNDEKETRLYGVFGKLDQEVPKFKFRSSLNGTFAEVSIFDIFDLPTLSMNVGNQVVNLPLTSDFIVFPQIDFPDEWMEIIREGKKLALVSTMTSGIVNIHSGQQMNFPSGIQTYNLGKDDEEFGDGMDEPVGLQEIDELAETIVGMNNFNLQYLIAQLNEYGSTDEIADILRDDYGYFPQD